MPTTASHVWRPSRARLVELDSFIPVPRGATAIALPPLSWAAKDPVDTLDYVFNISPALVGNDGDGIASLDVAISPAQAGDLTLVSAAVDGPLAVLWFSKGFAGTTYTVTITIVTNNARVLSRSVLLPVLSLSKQPVPLGALQTETGLALTDQNGNPVLISPPPV